MGHEPPEISAGAGADTDFGDWRADVELDARAAAVEVRHLDTPRTRIRVTGTAEARRRDFTRRENLPDPVEPGRTYRNVDVRRRVGGKLVVDEPASG
jgi:hypothetical protein